MQQYYDFIRNSKLHNLLCAHTLEVFFYRLLSREPFASRIHDFYVKMHIKKKVGKNIKSTFRTKWAILRHISPNLPNPSPKICLDQLNPNNAP